MRKLNALLVGMIVGLFSIGTHAAERGNFAVIGTGDMGDSLGPKMAAIGYNVIYGSRDPTRESLKPLVAQTGEGARATTQQEAAQAADIVLLAVGWPAMEQVAQNLGDLDGKIVIDVSFPIGQGDDGYPISTVETSSAEMIQGWNPGAKVVKWALPTAYYIDEPMELGKRPANWIAADDKTAKELVARIAAEIGQDPIDAGPLRMSREIEAQTLLFMVPLFQRRKDGWENIVRRSSFWECQWQDDWSEPVADSGDLAEFPVTGKPTKTCSEYPPWP